MHGNDEKCTQNINKKMRRGHLGDIGIQGRIILK
jgi:hypothetical protein